MVCCICVFLSLAEVILLSLLTDHALKSPEAALAQHIRIITEFCDNRLRALPSLITLPEFLLELNREGNGVRCYALGIFVLLEKILLFLGEAA